MGLDDWVAHYYPHVKPIEDEVRVQAPPARAEEELEAQPVPAEEQKAAKSRKPRTTRRTAQRSKK